MYNGLSAGINPVDIRELVGSVLDALFGNDDDGPDDMTAETPTAGRG